MPGPRTLVVASVRATRLTIVGMLRILGVTDSLEASDGAGAICALAGSHLPVELVISDYFMEPLDGLQLLRVMREEGLRSKFILMTNSPSVDVVVEARRLGASAVLAKPFSVSTLSSTLARVAQE